MGPPEQPKPGFAFGDAEISLLLSSLSPLDTRNLWQKRNKSGVPLCMKPSLRLHRGEHLPLATNLLPVFHYRTGAYTETTPVLSPAAAGRDVRRRVAKPAFPTQPGAGCILGTAAWPLAGREQQEHCKILLPTTTDQ